MEMTLDTARAPQCVNYARNAPKWTLWPNCFFQFVSPYLTVACLPFPYPFNLIKASTRCYLFVYLFIFKGCNRFLSGLEVGLSSW